MIKPKQSILKTIILLDSLFLLSCVIDILRPKTQGGALRIESMNFQITVVILSISFLVFLIASRWLKASFGKYFIFLSGLLFLAITVIWFLMPPTEVEHIKYKGTPWYPYYPVHIAYYVLTGIVSFGVLLLGLILKYKK